MTLSLLKYHRRWYPYHVGPHMCKKYIQELRTVAVHWNMAVAVVAVLRIRNLAGHILAVRILAGLAKAVHTQVDYSLAVRTSSVTKLCAISC